MIAEHGHVFIVDHRWDEPGKFLEISLVTGGAPLAAMLGLEFRTFIDRLLRCKGQAVVVIDQHGDATLEESNNFGNGPSPVSDLNDRKYKGACRQMLHPAFDIKEAPVVGVTLLTDTVVDHE